MQRLLNDLLWLLLPALVLVLVYLYGRIMPDALLLAVWLGLVLVMGAGAFLYSRQRRRVFLQAHVDKGSRLQHWLRGGPLLLLLRMLAALLLAAVLLVAMVRLRSPAEALLMILALLVLAVSRRGLAALLARHLTPAYLPVATWRLAQWITFLLLMVALSLLALWQPQPALAGISLDRAVWHIVDAEQARSGMLLNLLQINAALDGLRFWIGQQLIPALEWPLMETLAWLVLLGWQALVAWAWLGLCRGTLLLAGGRAFAAREPGENAA